MHRIGADPMSHTSPAHAQSSAQSQCSSYITFAMVMVLCITQVKINVTIFDKTPKSTRHRYEVQHLPQTILYPSSEESAIVMT